MLCDNNAQIAQLVEQRTENPRVAGSIPALGIFSCLFLAITKVEIKSIFVVAFFIYWEITHFLVYKNDVHRCGDKISCLSVSKNILQSSQIERKVL